MIKKQRVGITGANGTIGRVLLDGLKSEYELTAFSRRKVDFPTNIVNFDCPEEVMGKFEGLDAIIHLSADPSPLAPWESVRRHNVEAMYQVAEECVRSNVKRLVFASTNHTMHGHTMLTSPETLDATKSVRMKLSDTPNPDSLYAVSKLFGENLGKLYSEKWGLEFISLRIGWMIKQDDPTVMRDTPSEDYMRAMFLSQRYCVHAHVKALEVKSNFLIAYVVSNNGRRVFDLEETKINLGFDPKDDAEKFFAR